MRNRIERLRGWLLGGAILLVIVVVVFIGYARHMKRGFLARLPSKLGANIVRETNGFTYSQSVQGKTIYTIHAAKAIEHTDGKITLHDVAITIYGQKQDRADHIYGGEFEYDQKAGVVRAMGQVHLDLQAAPKGGSGPGTTGEKTLNPSGADDPATHVPKVLHATTSGLVYSQNLAVAATNEYIEFQWGGVTGHATGADYNTDSGLLMLHSSVNLSGIQNDRPFVLNAAQADLDPRNGVDHLTHAMYVSQGEKIQAEHATIQTRQDGSPERVLAEGDVTSEVNGATMTARKGDIHLTAKGQPEVAVLTGGLTYVSDQPLRQARGQADASTIRFDAKGQPMHAVFESAAGSREHGTSPVHMVERTRASEDEREPWSSRDLTAATVNADLVSVAEGKSELRDAQATGRAHLILVNNGSLKAAGGRGRIDLSADDLKTRMLLQPVAAKAKPGQPRDKDTQTTRRSPQSQLDTVEGRGHTVLRQVNLDGVEQTSSGDALESKFRPQSPSKNDRDGEARSAMEQIQTAEQQGHVTMTRHVPPRPAVAAGKSVVARKSSPAVDEEARAERASYDGDTDHLTLMGGVSMSEPGCAVWANQMVFDHGNGDATARGAVRVIYQQTGNDQNLGSQANGSGSSPKSGSQPGQEPTHVIAQYAELMHDAGTAIFYGGGGKPARLWQGGSQVEAPVIELEQSEHRLFAHGDASSGAGPAVHTVLVSQGQQSRPVTAKPTGSKKMEGSAKSDSSARSTQVVRVASQELKYSDNQRQADFTGGVRVEDADGTMLAQQATAYLKAAAAKTDEAVKPEGSETSTGSASKASASTGAGVSLGGGVDRMVATGEIEIEQPGRKATGDRLVYTASDGMYVLTGDGKVLPKVVDALHGTSTGASLGFHASDEAVTILGAVPGTQAAPGASAGRVHTEAKVKPDAKVKQ
jgi:lipopolysaccharide export system protein LptA